MSFQIRIELRENYVLVFTNDNLNELNKRMLFYRGSYKDINYIVIGEGTRVKDYVSFPVKRIKLLNSSTPERARILPHKNIKEYISNPMIELGRGLYGRVVKSGNFAIKTLFGEPNTKNPYLDYALLREVSVLKRLFHPNIVELIDVVNSDPLDLTANLVSIITELADYNLTDYLNKHGNSYRRHIVYQILKGFDYLHSKDIVHGDVKSDNILLFINKNNEIICKVSDFGLSIPTSCRPGSLHANAYNVYYRSLEVSFDIGYGISADIWAIACLIYYIYTLSYLFFDPSDELIIDEESKIKLIIPRIFKTLGNPINKWPELYNYLIKHKLNYTFQEYTSYIKDRVGNLDMYDIILEMLKYNPYERSPLSNILKHNTFTIYQTPPDYSSITCSSVTDSRQKYPSDIIINDDRKLASKQVILHLNANNIKIEDYFLIMYIYDCAYNTSIHEISEKFDFIIACIDICTIFQYGRSIFRKDFKSENAPKANDWNNINKMIKMIINILDFDLIVTTISDYLTSNKMLGDCIKAVENGVVGSYLPKDVIGAITQHIQDPSYFEILLLTHGK
jgi:serine/threonine protein kinase